MKRTLYVGLSLLISGILLSCNVQNTEQKRLPELPVQGAFPLPTSTESEYRYSPLDDEPDAKGKAPSVVDWSVIEPLLGQAQTQSGSEHVAIFGVLAFDGSIYSYYVQPLDFSSQAEAEAEANGQLRPYLYEIERYNGGPETARIAIAYIPDSDLAEQELTYWLRPRVRNRQDQSKAIHAKTEQTCYTEYTMQNGLLEEEIICELDDITVTAPPPDGGGGGGDLPEPNWNWPDPYDPGSGGGGGSTTTSPNCNPPDYCGEPDPDFCSIIPTPYSCLEPCEEIEALEDDNAFKSKMNTLQNNATSKNYETGYLLTGLVGGAGYSYTSIQGDPGQPEINFNLNGLNIDGYIHSHYQGTFSTFSGQDIRTVYQIYQIGKMNSLSTFTAGVVTAAGTSYIMKIDDVQAFLNFSGTYFQNQTTFQNFEILYNTNRELFIPLFGEVTGSELALLEILKSNDAGIKIFKGNANFSNWQAIQANASNTQVEQITCN